MKTYSDEEMDDDYDSYDDREHDYNGSPPKHSLQEDEGLDTLIDFLNTEKVDLNNLPQQMVKRNG